MSEKEFAEKFIYFKKEFFDCLGMTNIKYKKEIDIGYGISDIFYYDISENTVNKRKQLTKSKIKNKKLIEILLKIKNKKIISVNYLNNITNHLNCSTQKKIIDYLLKNKIILKEKNREYYCINKNYSPHINKSVAVEVKLKNWKRALFQAYRYNFVADKSFVVIPEEYSRQAVENILYFKKYNVGLITVTNTGINPIFIPRKNPKKYKNEVLLNYTFENLVYQY